MNKNAMFKIGYGLYVLTAKDEDKDNGCIVNTVMQLTDTPLRICVCVNKENYTHDMIMKTKKFNVSVINEKADFEMFKRFGFESGRNKNKFEGFEKIKRSENGILYITENCNAYISGEVIKTEDLGTHTMFVADVSSCEIITDETSVTYDYYFKNIKPKTNKEKKGYVCKICGYVYEGAELPEDYICPLCKHPASDFEEIK